MKQNSTAFNSCLDWLASNQSLQLHGAGTIGISGRRRFSVDAGDPCVASTLLIVPFPSPIFHLFCSFLSTRPRYITEVGFTLLLGVMGTWLKGERFLKALALLWGTSSHFRLSPWYTGSALVSRASVDHALIFTLVWYPEHSESLSLFL